MKIGVVVPSRLATNPASPAGRLWLDRCLGEVRRQEGIGDHALEIVVGLDPGAELPLRFIEAGVRAAHGTGNQASAVNAAVAALDCELLMFCEDDDAHHHLKFRYQLAALERGYDFISASQREVTVDGDYVRVCDFAGPSSWLMRAELWTKVGPMSESFKWHLDNDWLGRLAKSGAKRLHLAEHAAMVNPRPWLKQVGLFSKIGVTDGLLEPLVTRTVNPEGGMSRIARDPQARAESQREHMKLWELHGARIPW